MNDLETKQTIEARLKAFTTRPIAEAAIALFESLGYRSEKRIVLNPNIYENFRETFVKDKPFNLKQALTDRWQSVDLLFQLTGDEIIASRQMDLAFDAHTKVDNSIIESYLFFAVTLQNENYTRTQLSNVTREINKLFPMPVMVLFRHGNTLTFSIINRRLHKRDESKDVLEKVTLIKDIAFANPHRAHIEILYDLSFGALHEKHSFTNFVELHEAWRKTLDIQALNKRFFQEIANWYFWAVKNATFPKPKEIIDAEAYTAQSVIRLITRLIFCWFLKEKGLIPEDLFNHKKLSDLLTDLNPKQNTYYKAILQNLFFATLNQEMDQRAFRRDGQNFMAHNLYRYKRLLKASNEALKLFGSIPFLNGGLFECLDKSLGTKEKPIYIRIDGFSDRDDNPLSVPNFLFFNNAEKEVDLSTAYGEAKYKCAKVRGLIDIFESYKFTINENTPIEEEIALDPELLGKVFENLLAAYNPETGVTARKQTGSFYTPREIVNYMVDESLIACLKTKLESAASSASSIDERLRHLFAYNDQPHPFTPIEVDLLIKAIDHLKIFDPACGSGAFPMGVLHKLVFVLGKLDPGNERWKAMQIAKMDDPIMREQAEELFREHYEDYGRKLYLIENCIYGVDIQPIAVQIAKLRFFISLIVAQRVDPKADNLGVRPLPNLETKFVAANTLIGIERPRKQMLRNPQIDEKEGELRRVREHHFTARTPATKRKYREQDAKLRADIGGLLKVDGFPRETTENLVNWNPYDQNASAEFFDSAWMFGIAEGFDVVIANPPYINVNDMKKEVGLHKNLFSTIFGSYDIYVLFFEKSITILKKKGILTYITSNKYFIADYAKKLRKFILDNTRILVLLDLADCRRVFEHAFVSPAITILQKEKVDNYKIKLSLLQDEDIYNLDNVELASLESTDLVQGTNFVFDIYSAGENKTILRKLGNSTVPLGEVADVRTGIMGFEYWKMEPFVREGEKAGHIRIITNGQIDKFAFLFDQKINLYKKTFHNPYLDIKQAPINENTRRLFLSKKITIRGVAKKLSAQFDDDGFGVLVAVHTAIPQRAEYSTFYLLALLNSTLFNWYHITKFYTARIPMGSLKYPISFLKQIPIKSSSLQEQKPFIDLVDKILAITKDDDYLENAAKQAKVREYEKQIDQLVYKLYGLTPKEIKIVENQ